MPIGKEKNMFDLGSMIENTEDLGKEIDSGVPQAEKELEDLSFVKGTGRKDRNKDDPFAQLGL